MTTQDTAALIARIQAAIADIPPGRTCSYGVIAQRAGGPGRARLVGRVLRDAPAALQLPWHRIICASGKLAFPAGSAAYREQALRLQAEGVHLSQGRVDPACRTTARDLDALLWQPDH